MEIEAQIQQYVSRNLLFSDDAFSYGNDDSFLQEGIIDSMGVMDLVAFVGSTFGIQVDPKDITPDNFDSVNKLAGFIRRKRNSLSIQPPDGKKAKAAPWDIIEPSQPVRADDATAR